MDRCSVSNGPNKFRIDSSHTLAWNAVHFCRDTFNESKDDGCDLKREYWELPKDKIFIGDSPFDTLDIAGEDGITKYHCCLMQEKRVRFRKVSCCDDECVRSEHGRQCGNVLYAGRWSKWVDVPVHDKYAVMLAKANRKRRHEEDEQSCNRNRKKQKTT